MIYLPKFKLAFLHLMKCGGTSIVEWLQESAHTRIIKQQAYHEPLANKAEALKEKFNDTRIFTLIRNPFALIVSFYTFWRQFPREHSGDTIIAHDHTFSDFAKWFLQIAAQHRTDGPYMFKEYLKISNRIPPNLTIIRLEDVKIEVPKFLNRYEIPIKYSEMFCNISNRPKPVKDYYTEYLARTVYQQYRWCFKIGEYDPESWRTL